MVVFTGVVVDVVVFTSGRRGSIYRSSGRRGSNTGVPRGSIYHYSW